MKMKLTLLLGVITTIGYSQAGAKWSTGGNSTSTGDYLGTSNATPLIFKTNSNQVGMFDVNGDLILKNLGNGTKGIVFYDANGKLFQKPFTNSANNFLLGDGSWGSLSSLSNIWQTNSYGTFYNGKVGIGLSNPQYALDILGDARVSNNLIVGGGLIISQKVEASSSLKTDTVHSMTGETKFTSKVILKQQFQVDGTSLFNGTVQAGNLYVSGATNFANGANVNGTLNTSNLNVNGAFMANTLNVGTSTNNVDLKVQTDANGSTTIGFGYRSGPISSGPISCVVPYTGPITASFNGRSVITTAVTTDPVFDFRNNTTNGTIDYGFDYVANSNPPQRTGPSTIPSIKINGSCWGDVEIAKGGGFVSTGNHFEVGSPISNSDITSNILSRSKIGQRITLNTGMTDAFIQSNPSFTNYNTQLFVNKNLTRAISLFNTVTNTAGDEVFTIYGDGKTIINSSNVSPFEIIQNTTGGANGIKVTTNQNDLKVMSINNNNFSVPPFIVYGDGKTVIGVPKLITGPHIDALLTVGGKMVSQSCYVTQQNWSDFVFAKDYQMPKLSDIELYYKQNGHLPQIPSEKEVKENGIDLGEMNKLLLQKIEELTILMVEQDKRIKDLEKNK
jgi:hypothetical protein